MGVEYMIIALILFMLIAALIAVEARDLLSSVICVGGSAKIVSMDVWQMRSI